MQFSRLKRGRVYVGIGWGCYVFQTSLFYGVDGLKRLLCVMRSQDGNKGKYNSSDSREQDIGLRGARRGHHGFLTAQGYKI